MNEPKYQTFTLFAGNMYNKNTGHYEPIFWDCIPVAIGRTRVKFCSGSLIQDDIWNLSIPTAYHYEPFVIFTPAELETIRAMIQANKDIYKQWRKTNDANERGYCKACANVVEVEGKVNVQGGYNVCMQCGAEIADK